MTVTQVHDGEGGGGRPPPSGLVVDSVVDVDARQLQSQGLPPEAIPDRQEVMGGTAPVVPLLLADRNQEDLGNSNLAKCIRPGPGSGPGGPPSAVHHSESLQIPICSARPPPLPTSPKAPSVQLPATCDVIDLCDSPVPQRSAIPSAPQGVGESRGLGRIGERRAEGIEASAAAEESLYAASASKQRRPPSGLLPPPATLDHRGGRQDTMRDINKLTAAGMPPLPSAPCSAEAPAAPSSTGGGIWFEVSGHSGRVHLHLSR